MQTFPLMMKTDCPPFQLSRIAEVHGQCACRAGRVLRAHGLPRRAGERGLLFYPGEITCRRPEEPLENAYLVAYKCIPGENSVGKFLSPAKAIWTLGFLTRGASSDWPQGCGRFSCSRAGRTCAPKAANKPFRG